MPRLSSLKRPVRTVGSRLAVTALLLSVVAVLAGCAQQPPGPGGTGAPSGSATPPMAGIDLAITLTEAPGTAPRTFRLVAAGSTPAPESTLPDSAAALAAVEQHGEKIFFALPDPNRVCTQQYGGPQLATVTGTFKGRTVNAAFSRTDGCEIARWQALAPLFGALAGGTGAV